MLAVSADTAAIAGDDGVGAFRPSIHPPARAAERLQPEMLDALRATSGLTATVSDVLDEHGLELVAGADTIAPRTPGRVIVAYVMTLRYLPERGAIGDPAR